MRRLVIASAAALLVIGLAATAAQSSTGDPLIGGNTNSAALQTTLVGTQLPPPEDGPESVLNVVGGNSERYPAIAAQAPTAEHDAIRTYGGIGLNQGALGLGQNAQIVRVPAGSRSASMIPCCPNIAFGTDLSGTPIVLATLQQHRPNLWVKAAVPNRQAGTVTVYLNRRVAHLVTVAVAVLAGEG